MRALLVIALAGFIFITGAGWAIAEVVSPNNQLPVVVATIPQAGAVMVDAKLQEIGIVFSKQMRINGWSLVMQDKSSFPKVAGKVGFQNDGRTFIAPVTLEPDKNYVVWVNSDRYQNFCDQQGRPAVPYMLSFRTKP